MQPIQKSVTQPIRIIPNKSEASFNPYQSEAHLKSMRTLNPNESDQSESVHSFNTNESEIDQINFGFEFRIYSDYFLIGFKLIRIENLLQSHSE